MESLTSEIDHFPTRPHTLTVCGATNWRALEGHVQVLQIGEKGIYHDICVGGQNHRRAFLRGLRFFLAITEAPARSPAGHLRARRRRRRASPDRRVRAASVPGVRA